MSGKADAEYAEASGHFSYIEKTILKDRHIKLNITGLAAFTESLKHEGAVKLTGIP